MTQEEKTELLKIDICARLPYGVRYYDLGYDDAPKIEAYRSDDYADWEENETGGFFAIGRRIVLGEDMPLLRPLSDLYTEITHAGDNDGIPFVPIVKLAEVSYPHSYWGYIGNEEACELGPVHFWDRKTFCYDSGTFEVQCADLRLPANGSDKLFDLLNRLMIDYRGLIDLGLAKSVHDLDKNPYE